MSQQRYFATGSESESERERLSILEQLFDDVTRRSLLQLGVSEGWRCCEIGAGGGSVARWLAQVVGPSGRVVAVDLDTRFLDDIDQPNVDVIKADFLSDAPIGGSFDLVLTRFVLCHLPDPKRAIYRMVQLLKPNGWVFAIDRDRCNLSAADLGHCNARRFDAVHQRWLAYHRDRYNLKDRIGRSLSKLLEETGLVDVNNSAWTSVSRGGSLQADLWRRTFAVSAPRMMADGVLSREESELFLSTMTDPTFRFLDALWFQASGRKPPM